MMYVRLVPLGALVVAGVATSSLAQRAGPPASASVEFMQQMRQMELVAGAGFEPATFGL